MVFKSKIKWIAIFVLVLSMGSLFVHLSMTRFSSVDLVQYSAMVALSHDFVLGSGIKALRNQKLWGHVRSLQPLQPYANPRSSYAGPKERNSMFIYAKIFGGFEKIRSSICDLVIIARLLNATLVIPDIQESLRSKGISNKFKSFPYLYDEDQFIASLRKDVTIIKSLPANFMAGRKRNEYPMFKPKSSTSPDFYVNEILPKLKQAKVIGLILSDGGCLQSILPPSMSEFQRLRCRVAFHALQFRPEIQMLGHKMVERLRAWNQPFLVFHPGLVRETLAYHGCAELFQDVHAELIQHRRAKMIKQGIVKEELRVDSHLRRDNGLCPLMPEEVGVVLRAFGYPPKTIIYIAGSEIFGGQRVMIPLLAMFSNLVDCTSLCSDSELSELVGSENPLPPDHYQVPSVKSEAQLKEEWKKAGPRPRPLPPPPDRPIYQHEKEGWYGWITVNDTESSPSPIDLRKQAHRLLWGALDYIVSLEADAYFPGFYNDGSGWPDFSSLVMGQRLYERASSRTYRPDRKVIQELLNVTRDDIYHPKRNWKVLMKEHLNKSLGEDGFTRQFILSKPNSFLSHPLPECSCRTSSVGMSKQLKDDANDNEDDKMFLNGDEDKCPEWIQSAEAKRGKIDEVEMQEYENDPADQTESEEETFSSVTLAFDHDDESDPND